MENNQHGVSTVLLGLCCPVDYLAKMSAIGERYGTIMIDGMHVMLKHIETIQQDPNYAEDLDYYRKLYGNETISKHRIFSVTSDSCHPNRIGHRILAEELYQRLLPVVFSSERAASQP